MKGILAGAEESYISVDFSHEQRSRKSDQLFAISAQRKHWSQAGSWTQRYALAIMQFMKYMKLMLGIA